MVCIAQLKLKPNYFHVQGDNAMVFLNMDGDGQMDHRRLILLGSYLFSTCAHGGNIEKRKLLG